MTHTYPEYVAMRDGLDAALVKAGKALTETRNRLAEALGIAPFGAMNLTPDCIKSHPDYRRDNLALNKALERLRTLNGTYAQLFAKEERAAIMAKRMAKLETKGN